MAEAPPSSRAPDADPPDAPPPAPPEAEGAPVEDAAARHAPEEHTFEEHASEHVAASEDEATPSRAAPGDPPEDAPPEDGAPEGDATGALGMDPRDIVTEYAFVLDGSLLGKPLASPTRRFFALMADLLLASFLVGLLALAGKLAAYGVAAGLAYLTYRLARRSAAKKTFGRWLLAVLGALVVFVLVAKAIQAAGGAALGGLVVGGGLGALLGWMAYHRTDLGRRPRLALAGAAVLVVGVALWPLLVPADAEADGPAEGVAAQASAADAARDPDAFERAVTDSVASALRRAGLDPARLGLAPTPVAEADTSAAARAEAAALLRRYADAYAAADSLALDSLQARAASLVAGDRLRALRGHIDALDDENDRLGDRLDDLRDERDAALERAAHPGVLRVLRATADDMGLTFGWMGVYFTLALTWWNGQTPGKRLFGLRVVRLDGEPMTLWLALERFGGYAAGVATGLLGFAQIRWDANRQGIQDRIAGTVVVRERAA